MNKVILFLKHGNPDRPLMRAGMAVPSFILLFSGALTGALALYIHLDELILPTCFMAGGLLLGGVELLAADPPDTLTSSPP